MNNKTLRHLLLALWLVAAVVLALECWSRVALGMGHAPVYQASDEWEYMAAPSQSGRRFGNRWSYNSVAMRSGEVDSARVRILGLGDSVLFGGVLTDQDSLATEIFSRRTGVQMLNISAGSWGPDNCAAYLKHYGTFGASAIFLYVSSHDAHDVMDFRPTVGVHKSYPAERYTFGLVELWERYVKGRVLGVLGVDQTAELDPDQRVLAQHGEIRKGAGPLNPGFDELLRIARRDSLPLVVCLHPTLPELECGAYGPQGEEIMQWADSCRVRLVREMDCGLAPDCYRDGIHINPRGQACLERIMERELLPLLTMPLTPGK